LKPKDCVSTFLKDFENKDHCVIIPIQIQISRIILMTENVTTVPVFTDIGMSANSLKVEKAVTESPDVLIYTEKNQSTINNDDIESAHKGRIKDLEDAIA
jgi:hypothetical protein